MIFIEVQKGVAERVKEWGVGWRKLLLESAGYSHPAWRRLFCTLDQSAKEPPSHGSCNPERAYSLVTVPFVFSPNQCCEPGFHFRWSRIRRNREFRGRIARVKSISSLVDLRLRGLVTNARFVSAASRSRSVKGKMSGKRRLRNRRRKERGEIAGWHRRQHRGERERGWWRREEGWALQLVFPRETHAVMRHDRLALPGRRRCTVAREVIPLFVSLCATSSLSRRTGGRGDCFVALGHCRRICFLSFPTGCAPLHRKAPTRSDNSTLNASWNDAALIEGDLANLWNTPAT